LYIPFNVYYLISRLLLKKKNKMKKNFADAFQVARKVKK
jgi:hypothetical protein